MPRTVRRELNIAYNTSEVDEEFTFGDLVDIWNDKKQLSFGTAIARQVAI